MQDLVSLNGRIALVTGGSRGIGEMIAEGYVKAGAKVYISARKAAVCEETAKRLSAFGECIAMPADASGAAGAGTLADLYLAKESELNILVNNAGAAWGAEIETFPESGWDKVMNLNVKARSFWSRRCSAPSAPARLRSARPGHQHRLDRRALGEHAADLFILGLQGGVAPSDQAPRARTRAATHRRVRHRAGSICFQHEQARRDKGDALAKQIPSRRIGTPEDMAGAAIVIRRGKVGRRMTPHGFASLCGPAIAMMCRPHSEQSNSVAKSVIARVRQGSPPE